MFYLCYWKEFDRHYRDLLYSSYLQYPRCRPDGEQYDGDVLCYDYCAHHRYSEHRCIKTRSALIVSLLLSVWSAITSNNELTGLIDILNNLKQRKHNLPVRVSELLER